jgi:hypothetical protein
MIWRAQSLAGIYLTLLGEIGDQGVIVDALERGEQVAGLGPSRACASSTSGRSSQTASTLDRSGTARRIQRHESAAPDIRVC